MSLRHNLDLDRVVSADIRLLGRRINGAHTFIIPFNFNILILRCQIYALRVGRLASAFRFRDLNVFVRRPTLTFRRWCNLDPDTRTSRICLTTLPALKVFY